MCKICFEQFQIVLMLNLRYKYGFNSQGSRLGPFYRSITQFCQRLPQMINTMTWGKTKFWENDFLLSFYVCLELKRSSDLALLGLSQKLTKVTISKFNFANLHKKKVVPTKLDFAFNSENWKLLIQLVVLWVQLVFPPHI